jgi:transcriptional regulator with XRE-family HTH domain
MARPKRPPFTPRLQEHRRRLGLTQEQVAEQIGITAEMVRRHERAISLPSAIYQRRYTELYGRSAVELGLRPTPEATLLQSSNEERAVARSTLTAAPATLSLPLTPRLGNEDLANIHGYMKNLVALDNRFGGTEIAGLAGRFFKSLHHQIGTGSYEPSIKKDLIATTGELAEITGWLAYDADDHALVRRMNQESLYFTRLAGDTQVELLTLQNASMHAGFLDRPREALDLADSVLEGSYSLTPRLRALFLVRKARALAQGGDVSALRFMQEAQSLHADGLSSSDPAWAWWIDERELQWHEAMCRQNLGDEHGALTHFELSVEATSANETRKQYLHRAYLLQAQTKAHSWSSADRTMQELFPLTREVESNRIKRLIVTALRELDIYDGAMPGGVRENATQLHRLLNDDTV